jgi:hypothetical protein
VNKRLNFLTGIFALTFVLSLVSTQASQANIDLTDPYFSLETKAGITAPTPLLFSDNAGVLNFTALFSPQKESPWVYFLDYSVTRYFEAMVMESDALIPNDFHFLMLGYRYYFDFGWPVSPYFSLSLGLLTYHIPVESGPTYFAPMIAGGIGMDYMLTPHFGLNIEANVPVFLLQLKGGIKYVF